MVYKYMPRNPLKNIWKFTVLIYDHNIIRTRFLLELLGYILKLPNFCLLDNKIMLKNGRYSLTSRYNKKIQCAFNFSIPSTFLLHDLIQTTPSLFLFNYIFLTKQISQENTNKINHCTNHGHHKKLFISMAYQNEEKLRTQVYYHAQCLLSIKEKFLSM